MTRKLAAAGALVLAGYAAAGFTAAEPADESGGSRVEFVTVEELKAKVAAGGPVTIIDVRAAAVYSAADERIQGALRIKLRRLRSRLAFPPLRDLPRDREVVTYCACPADEAGVRAAQLLVQAGFKRVRVLKGGWEAWLAAGGPIEQTARTGAPAS